MSTYFCEQCDYSTNRSNNWKRHLSSSKHLRCGKVKTYHCDCCNMTFGQKSHFDDHLKTDGHQQKVQYKQLTFVEKMRLLRSTINELMFKKIEIVNERDDYDNKLNPRGFFRYCKGEPILTPRQQQWKKMIDALIVKLVNIDEQIDIQTDILYDLVYPVLHKLRLTKPNLFGYSKLRLMEDKYHRAISLWKHNFNNDLVNYYTQ